MKLKTNLDLQEQLVYAQSLLLGCSSFLEELKDSSECAYTKLTVNRLLSQIQSFISK